MSTVNQLEVGYSLFRHPLFAATVFAGSGTTAASSSSSELSSSSLLLLLSSSPVLYLFLSKSQNSSPDRTHLFAFAATNRCSSSLPELERDLSLRPAEAGASFCSALAVLVHFWLIRKSKIWMKVSAIGEGFSNGRYHSYRQSTLQGGIVGCHLEMEDWVAIARRQKKDQYADTK